MKKTVKQLYEDLKQIPMVKKAEILAAVGRKDNGGFTDICTGRRKLSPAEKKEVASIFGLSVDDIAWKDEKNLIA